MSTRNQFFAVYFMKVHLRQFSKIKSHKEVTKHGNQSFSNFICLMVEGSGSGYVQKMTDLDLDPGGPITYGS
jgi:hypothetical protein